MGRKAQQSEPIGDNQMLPNIPNTPLSVEDVPASQDETQEAETPIIDILNPLHEAGGVVFGPLFDQNGDFFCNVTARAMTAIEALDAYVQLAEHAAQRYGLTIKPAVPLAPSAQPVQPSTPSNQSTYSQPTTPATPAGRPQRSLPTYNGPDTAQAVISVSKLESRNNPGVFFLKVKTQGFPDGVMAFADVVPMEWGFHTWPKFKELGLPVGWTKAVVGADKKGNAIVKGFQP